MNKDNTKNNVDLAVCENMLLAIKREKGESAIDGLSPLELHALSAFSHLALSADHAVRVEKAMAAVLLAVREESRPVFRAALGVTLSKSAAERVWLEIVRHIAYLTW